MSGTVTLHGKDGLPIAATRTGSGPPLLIVHGTGGDASRWEPVLPALAAQFTCYAVNRRGRNGSGDAEPYRIEDEFADVAALIDGFDEAPFVLAHSYGALATLEALRRTARPRRVVLYEPPVPVNPPISPEELIDRMTSALAAEDRERVIETFVLEVVQAPRAELDLMRASPTWAARLAAAHTVPRELSALNRHYRFDPADFADVATPIRLLLGSESRPFLKDATYAVKKALPSATLEMLAGQQHNAMNTAPGMFTDAVLRFLAPRD